ncbi:MAG: hypothetical protein D6772_05085 [Bacteroidetes bacterium]|nr:MAG: hypothetical protein D6772_05085 [Bacteroidota bacterium]
MRIFYFCCLLYFFAPIALSAQMPNITARVRWGPTEKAPKDSYLSKVVAAGTWGAYILRRKPPTLFKSEQFWLERYGNATAPTIS